MSTKNIILCADDYGQNEATSQGIIQLIQLNRLSATSCLTTTNNWPIHAQQLRPFHGQIAIGLHLNLTEQPTLQPEAYRPLAKLILQAHLQQLDPKLIENGLKSGFILKM